jgi:glycosyltransferase involved in cell wall biosynthesis
MKILYIPTYSSAYDYEKSVGGLASVQQNLIKNLGTRHQIHYLSFSNDKFGPHKPHTVIDIGLPLESGGSVRIWHARKRAMLRLGPGLREFDAVIGIEMSSHLVKLLNKLEVGHKILNVLATPYNPTARGILELYEGAVMIKKSGGYNLVQTDTFDNYVNKVYPNLPNQDLAKREYKELDLDFWRENPITHLVKCPTDFIENRTIVRPANDDVLSIQRWDPKFRKTGTAIKCLESLENKTAYFPLKTNTNKIPSKVEALDFVKIGRKSSEIQEHLSRAKCIVNTCHNTGTVEHGSLEAISKGVPVIQLLETGHSHATLEYDPTTVVVEYTGNQAEDAARLAKACNSVDETLEQRQARADYCYERYNEAAYFDAWQKILESASKARPVVKVATTGW